MLSLSHLIVTGERLRVDRRRGKKLRFRLVSLDECGSSQPSYCELTHGFDLISIAEIGWAFAKFAPQLRFSP